MVVKCGECDKYFTHTEQDTKCPFCQTEYVEIVQKEIKEKKGAAKIRKGHFKLWSNSSKRN